MPAGVAVLGITSVSGSYADGCAAGVLPGPGPFSTENALPIIFPEVLGGTLAALLPSITMDRISSLPDPP